MTDTTASMPLPDLDAETLRRASAGDCQAFAAVFDTYYEFIYRVAFKHVGSKADAEDVAQETVVKLARKLGSYRFEARFSTWLYRLTANTAKDWLRKGYRKRELGWPETLDVASADPSPEHQAITRDILGTLERLPEKLREAVRLVFVDGLSHGQAAEHLGCAESTVSWRIHEARKVLTNLTDPANAEGPRHA